MTEFRINGVLVPGVELISIGLLKFAKDIGDAAHEVATGFIKAFGLVVPEFHGTMQINAPSKEMMLLVDVWRRCAAKPVWHPTWHCALHRDIIRQRRLDRRHRFSWTKFDKMIGR